MKNFDLGLAEALERLNQAGKLRILSASEQPTAPITAAQAKRLIDETKAQP